MAAALPLHPRRRVPGHQRRAVSLAAAAGAGAPQPVLRRRRRPVDLQLARRRGRQHPALREGFPRRPGDPAGAELPLDTAHPRRRRGADRAQRGAARQDAVDRRGRRRKGRRCAACGTARRRRAGSATRSRRCSAAATSCGGIAILVRAGFQTREFEERFITLGVPLPRDRRAALLRAPGDPRRDRLSAHDRAAGRRSRLRAHRQRAAARHRRRDDAGHSSPVAREQGCR